MLSIRIPNSIPESNSFITKEGSLFIALRKVTIKTYIRKFSGVSEIELPKPD